MVAALPGRIEEGARCRYPGHLADLICKDMETLIVIDELEKHLMKMRNLFSENINQLLISSYIHRKPTSRSSYQDVPSRKGFDTCLLVSV